MYFHAVAYSLLWLFTAVTTLVMKNFVDCLMSRHFQCRIALLLLLSHEEALADHDRNLIALLQRFSERNFKLNKDKFVFKQQKLKYCGHILTSEGILPDPAKVEAITQMPRPRSKTEVRRLLRMINYLGKFLPQLSDVSEPLTNLTKAQNQFIWSKVQQDAFNKLTRL